MLQPIVQMFDAQLELKTSGAVTTDTSHTSVSLGTYAGVIKAVIDITAIDVANGDENYKIIAQGSPDGGTTWYNLGSVEFGDSSTLAADDPDTAQGQEELFFSNKRRVPSTADGVPDQLEDIRLHTDVTGITPSITFSAHATLVTHGG